MKKLAVLFCLASCVAQKPTQRLSFQAPDAYPEGIAYDSTGDRFFVSSMRSGTIGTVSTAGSYQVFYADSSLKSTYGLKIHPNGRELLACVSDANYSRYTNPATKKKLARLISIDIASGKKMTDKDLSALVNEPHFINDLCFDKSGNMYVTDSYAHSIYLIPAQGTPELFSKDPLFVTAGVGINGIVHHPDNYLLVCNSGTGGLYKVAIPSGKASMVKTDQFFLGADGLLLSGNNTLTMAVNGGNDKIFELSSTDGWASASLTGTTLLADRFTYPATITAKGKEIWVMNAKTNELVDSNNVPSKKFDIQKAVIKPVPAKKP